MEVQACKVSDLAVGQSAHVDVDTEATKPVASVDFFQLGIGSSQKVR